MNVLDKGHLNKKAKNQGKYADFKVGKFHDFDGSNNDTNANDIVDDPILIGKEVTKRSCNSDKQTDNV